MEFIVLVKCFWCCSYVPNPVLVIIDVQPKELGIPTKAYYDVEEVKEVRTIFGCIIFSFVGWREGLNCWRGHAVLWMLMGLRVTIIFSKKLLPFVLIGVILELKSEAPRKFFFCVIVRVGVFFIYMSALLFFLYHVNFFFNGAKSHVKSC